MLQSLSATENVQWTKGQTDKAVRLLLFIPAAGRLEIHWHPKRKAREQGNPQNISLKPENPMRERLIFDLVTVQRTVPKQATST